MEKLRKKAKEGDVEHRVVLPFLKDSQYLGIPAESIRSKGYLRPQNLEKAAGKTTGYYPDFSVWDQQLPLLVVEAKAPTVKAEVGYREAQLYASHLNRLYRSGINPCAYLLSTNGERMLVGPWDSNPEFDIDVEDIAPGSSVVFEIQQRIGFPALQQLAVSLDRSLRSNDRYFATRGSKKTTLLASKIPPNRFASALIPTLTRYFASPADDGDPAVYEKSYVHSDERTSYDAILDSLLKERAYHLQNPLSQELTTTQTSTPAFTNKILEHRTRKPNTAQLLLVVGHVGAGKSLFIRRYRQLLVPVALRSEIKWSFINFNNSPVNLENAESWACSSFVESFEAEQPDIDLFSEDMTNKIFGVELRHNRALYESLAVHDKLAAAKSRADDIKALRENPLTFSRCITRYFGGERGETCVVVFDNVDKLDRNNQLSAFQLALWFMNVHRSYTILQLRDETFERYKNTKPLDTYAAGVSFHITAPGFLDVVRRRLDICIEDIELSAPKSWEYDLSNSMRVSIQKSSALDFLREIYRDVFEQRHNVGRILQGLAGKNIRNALDMFFSILISGHFSEDSITSYGTGGRILVSEESIIGILMKTNYRFFHEGSGFIHNIFHIEDDWLGSDNFIISEVLYFLARNRKVRGTIGYEGFFSVERISEDLERFGYPVSTVEGVCRWILDKELVDSDRMNKNDVDKNTALRISASGFIHLRILSERVEYLFNCLYGTPFLLKEAADLAAENFDQELLYGELSSGRKATAVGYFRNYLAVLFKRREESAPNLVGIDTGASYIINQIENADRFFRRRQASVGNVLDA